MTETKRARARALRYKRPALASLGYETIYSELDRIRETCEEVQWYIDEDDDQLLNALDGDDEAVWEFKTAFADLTAKTEEILEAVDRVERDCFSTSEEFARLFDDCTVALIGNRYEVVGYDSMEEDYFHLIGYEQALARTEAGKRLMRKTKADMLSTIGMCVGITLAFLDLRQQYDYLKATMEILRDENSAVTGQLQAVEDAYCKAEAVDFAAGFAETRTFERLLDALPAEAWVG